MIFSIVIKLPFSYFINLWLSNSECEAEIARSAIRVLFSPKVRLRRMMSMILDQEERKRLVSKQENSSTIFWFDLELTRTNAAIARNCNAKFDNKNGADAGD